MKVAVVSANIGGIDEPQAHVEQSMRCHIYYVTEHNMPFPMPDFSDRLKSKYIKIQMHRFLPGFDYYIWMDGRIRMANADMVKEIIGLLKTSDFVFTAHPDRQTLAEEFDLLISCLEKNDPYIIERYAHSAFHKERAHYEKYIGSCGAMQLFASGFFAFAATPGNFRFMDEWWEMVIRFGVFDQSQLAAMVYKVNPQKTTIPLYNNGLFEIGKHKPRPTE
ncbi:MAG TPA: glycosyltransferase domain-containing protein [Chitinophagales bacterium]|nr:glycosyltransferase domain-containing protein [Chitinophagales bacterium]